MEDKNIGPYSGHQKLSVVEALERIDKNAHGILFIVSEDGSLTGSVTDGDIRRWLIATGELSSTVQKIMNRSPKFLYEADRQKAEEYMNEHVLRALPVLNKKRQIVEIVFHPGKEICVSDKKSSLFKTIPVIIMAGGKGTRLYPFTKILPKPLIPIGDIPIIVRIINQFCMYGVSDFYLTVNYRKEMIKSYFADLELPCRIHYIEEEIPLGTAGSIRLIERTFHTPVIVTNCDILIRADYENIIEYHEMSHNALTIVSALKNVTIPYGVLHAGEEGIVTLLEEKPRLDYFVNTGMYVLQPELLKMIPEKTFYHMTDLTDVLLKNGEKVGMYPVSEDSFLDMGEFEEMRRMEEKIDAIGKVPDWK